MPLKCWVQGVGVYVVLVWVRCRSFQKMFGVWARQIGSIGGQLKGWSQVGMVVGRHVHTWGWHLVGDIYCWCVWFTRVSDVDGLATESLAAPFMFLAAASCWHTNSHTSKIMSIILRRNYTESGVVLYWRLHCFDGVVCQTKHQVFVTVLKNWQPLVPCWCHIFTSWHLKWHGKQHGAIFHKQRNAVRYAFHF